jgi:hypothetical protein
MIVAEKFKEHFAPGHFSRINTEHPLDIYIGVDEQCHYALEFRGQFIPQLVKSSNSIGIKQYQTPNFAGIIFSLNEQDMLDNFCVFCEDIINSTATTTEATNGYKLVINRFYAWKKMFQTKSKIMDESRIMGLIGELIFLRDYMIPKYGELMALRAWSGQELTHKDFSLDTIWYETKAVSTGKPTVKISSLEQLQSPNDGELVVFQLEKMSPAYAGINLNKLASEILKKLDSDEHKDIFINKLVDSGFSFEAIYNEFVYEVSAAERFLVNSTFPRLVTNDVNEAIVKVQYELLLSFIQEYKIEWHYGD